MGNRHLVALIFTALAFVATQRAVADEVVIDQWENTVYYRYSVNCCRADTPAVLRVTSVDEYELFLNGESLGQRTDWTTMEEFQVTLGRSRNDFGFVVRNKGENQGSGLLMELVSEDKVWISTSAGLHELWAWTGVEQEGDDWLTEDSFELLKLDEWERVQAGNLDTSMVAGRTDSLNAEVVAGYVGGIDGASSAGLTLRNVFGENLALGQLAPARAEPFDGRANTAWNINDTQLNDGASIDLAQRRLVTGVRVLTEGEDEEDWAKNSVKGYAVQVSDDGFRWTEVAVIQNIDQPEQFERTSLFFEPISTRFVRIVIAQVQPLTRAVIAEIQILGMGRALSGSYTSPAHNLGRGIRKNFGRAQWWGDVPNGTNLSLQFRSADADDPDAWSPWSNAVSDSISQLDVPEPREFIQYRVSMTTESDLLTPRLDSLKIEFTDTFPVSNSMASVEPNLAVLGRDTTFTYTLDLDFNAGDTGVGKVEVDVPSLPTDLELTLPAGVQASEPVLFGDKIEVNFDGAWNSDGQLTMRFGARLLSNAFTFSTRLFAPNSDEPLHSEEDTRLDRSWTVRAGEVRGALLSSIKVNPTVFSPNNDTRNDNTVVEFTLSRVSEPQDVQISILDLSGRLIRDLDSGFITGGQYIRPPAGLDPTAEPGYWNGKDNEGNTVPPGIYLVRVKAVLEREEEVRVRPVAVAY
jgi:hypothetical protein